MGYVENALFEDESIVLHHHPHVKRLVGPVLALVLLTAVAAFGAAVVNGTDWDRAAKTVISCVVLVLWLSLLGWLVVVPLLSWRATHFVVTDRRIMSRRGLLTRSGIDIPLARIDGVEFSHGLFDRLLRTGTLIVESAANDALEFPDIPRVARVHGLLYRELFDPPGSR